MIVIDFFEIIIKNKFKNGLIHRNSLNKVFPKLSKSQIDAKIKICVKLKKIFKIKHGLYILSPRYLDNKYIHPEWIAQQLIPDSYISGYYALYLQEFHNKHLNYIDSFIPNADRQYKKFSYSCELVTWVRKDINIEKDTVEPYNYEFLKIKVNEKNKDIGIKEIKHKNISYKMATPLRAITDLFVCKYLSDKNFKKFIKEYSKDYHAYYLLDMLGIEFEDLKSIELGEFERLKKVYELDFVDKFLMDCEMLLRKYKVYEINRGQVYFELYEKND